MIWLALAINTFLTAIVLHRCWQAEERAKLLEMSVMFLSARVALLEEDLEVSKQK